MLRYTLLALVSFAAAKHTQREPLVGNSGSWKDKKKPGGPPKDYKVPNFGVDRDIVDTRKHLAAAEKRLKHKWVVSTKKPEPPLDLSKLRRPDFGVDRDIAITHRHMKAAEARHRRPNWNPEPFLNVQL